MATDHGRIIIQQIKLMRLWNANHGGVYVKISEKAKPNPYLDVPERDLITKEGKEYTLINPAYMTRQVSEILKTQKEITLHITSLKPIRPENKADSWESEVLTAFEKGEKERIELLDNNSNKEFKYMAPLYVKNECLKCHGKQGYKSGDIRGGISVTIPADHIFAQMNNQRKNLILLHVGIFIIGSVGIIFFQIHSKHKKEAVHRSEFLKTMNEELEKKVNEETEKRRKKEQILMQQSKMAAMGEMISAIAHQWRQPLNRVGIIIQDIQDAYEFGELNQTYINNNVEESFGQIQFMSETIDDFRNFFKPSKEYTTFNAVTAVNDVLSIVSAQLNSSSIRIEMHVTEGEAFSLKGYLNEFMHVVLNIINNAKDAILEARGKDNLADNEGKISINISHEKDKVIIRIIDNGGGIPEEVQERIFEPYFTTKGDSDGTGIGLYMSKVIIENNMNGKLFTNNIVNGAVFTIEM